MEKIRGSLIFPAMRQPKGSALFQLAEQCKSPLDLAGWMCGCTDCDAVCKEIDCSGPGSESGELDW